ncbi:unnamed protein product [Microthlaspi erraticum]|uniref:Integrase catalytic domain-containing protein n=1 Tax=Microthlaspi erraticum TaxID=1685480 RepID=A0A6D2JRL1_9BRAS|nr:unnamed protein product [Microthlaspi erraticum]
MIVTDYFTKWVETKAYKNPTAHDVKNFVWQYIICRHGLPYEIVTDNGGQFVAATFHLKATKEPGRTKSTESFGHIAPRPDPQPEPFSLSHGCEALAPAELHVASLRRSLMPHNPALNDDSLLHGLDHSEELRDRALLRMKKYNQQATRYYVRNLRNRRFALHDLVFQKIHDFTKPEHAGKFKFKWEGPYRITKIVKPELYELDDCHGNPLHN